MATSAWSRPPNTSIADLAEMAMAGMDFGVNQEAYLVTYEKIASSVDWYY